MPEIDNMIKYTEPVLSDLEEFDKKLHKEELSEEAKEDIHYMKGDLKDFRKQLKTKESIVTKNDTIAILHSGNKNQKSFLSEFEKLTKEGYMLTGITETKGMPLKLFGFDVKTGKLFFFQRKKWIR